MFKKTKPIGLVLVLALALVVGIVLPYALTFTHELSLSSEDWGNFGDYVGGTLGPILAFLAFSLGLLTLYASSQQARKDGLLKTIQSLERDFEVCVSKPVTCTMPMIWGNDFSAGLDIQEVSLRTLLESDGVDWEHHLPLIANGLKFRVLPSGELIQDRDLWLRAHITVEGIYRYLKLYRDAGGDESLTSYLQSKYEIARNRLTSSGAEADAAETEK